MRTAAAVATAAALIAGTLTAVAVAREELGGSAPTEVRAPVTLRARDAVDAVSGRDYRPLRTLHLRTGASARMPVALTPDGTLVRTVPRRDPYDYHVDYDVLDPRTGRHELLPRANLVAPVFLDAGAETPQVAVDKPRPAVVSSDRRTRRWSRSTLPDLPLPAGARVQEDTASRAADGRVYVATSSGPEPERGQLWSYPSDDPAAFRREGPIGQGFSADGDLLAYVDPPRSGAPAMLHLRTLSTGRQRSVRLPGCLVDGVQGDASTVAVHVFCHDKRDFYTKVFASDGTLVANLVLPADSFVTDVTDRFVLLVGPYAFDIRHRRLLRLSHYGYDIDPLPVGSSTGSVVGIPDGTGGLRRQVRLVEMTDH